MIAGKCKRLINFFFIALMFITRAILVDSRIKISAFSAGYRQILYMADIIVSTISVFSYTLINIMLLYIFIVQTIYNI